MKKQAQESITVSEIHTGSFTVHIVGTTPILCNAMSAKVRMDLLAPRGKKTTAEKQTQLKHDPIAEYRRSAYRTRNPDAPTLIYHPGDAWKKCIANTAVDIPGAARAQIGRLCWVEGREIPLWGVPQLHMGVVRAADMNRTPDVRTRAVLPEWASVITVTYVKPNITEQALLNLIASGGLINGQGDWRQQKGGSFGRFRIARKDDPELQRIMKTGGREAQVEGFANPTPFDLETEELYEAFLAEIAARGRQEQITKAEPSRNGGRKRREVAVTV